MKTILLDTPWTPPVADGNTYDRVNVTLFQWDIEAKNLNVEATYGYLDGGVWTRGVGQSKNCQLNNAPGIYDNSQGEWIDLSTESFEHDDIVDRWQDAANNGANPWDGFMETLLQKLIDMGYFAGTLAD